MGQVTLDFVTRRPDGSYCIRLLEEGLWNTSTEEALSGIQSRLFDAVEVIIEGRVAELYPESKGQKIYIALDCFRLPREDMGTFFSAFLSFIRSSPEWASDCEAMKFEIPHLEEPNRVGGGN
ncbi:MAG: hypothetical protein J6386_09285 [Candidatus Synoicihabitans palmerolidicus]|nr:hypothetical protein [Candidatus Synoicihabitans palmerolidicus]